MRAKIKYLVCTILLFLALLTGCGELLGTEASQPENEVQVNVTEDGEYTGKEEVAAYLHEFGRLPDNFITKNEAKKLGWVSKEGNLSEAAPGKSIGGDRFRNY